MSKFCMGCMEQYEDSIDICPHCGYKEGTDPVQALHMKPGTILHERYIVGKALGFGGFGVTYIGWDALLENKIAIKEFLPSEFSTRMPGVSYVTVYSGDKYKQFNTGLDRFIEEAKKLAQLNNVENIVTIYDCFKENNTAYIIMEYLEGETIAERLKREKKIPYEEAVGMLIPIVDALSVVHKHDILHRDIAPDNIFVTNDNKIKLLDFGAARYATTSHSRSLTVIIKPGYSPEEQYRSNGDQGTYTDVYAVAATLYKMITGITPSDALERRANIESKNKDPLKPLVQYCSDIDENTENAILNAMNVRIEDRTPTMAAFKEELTSLTPVKRVAGKIRKIDLLRWPLWAKITIPVLSALILVTGILFATGIIGFSSGPNENIEIADGMTRVPSLINGTVSDADERLKNAVLIYIISGKEYSDDIPADYVLTQDVSAGSIIVENSIVNIIVSGGDSDAIEKDFMADLTYMDVEKAMEILKSQGFTPEIEYTTSETVGAGLVISQNIEHGARFKTDDKIQLVVSSGQPSFAMPNVTGKSENDARNVLSDNGLTCSVEYVFSNTVAKGNVITQSISANAQVKKGTNVALTVSNGAVSITSVSIKSNPTKTSYYVGETLNTSGLTLTAKYNDGSIKTISSGFTCNPTSLTSAGTKTITVSYSGKSTSFNVSVQNVSLSSITVKTQPTKTSYYVGDTLNTSGLTLTAKYNDGSTKTISSGFTCNPTSLTSAGTKTITVSYSGKSATFNVSVQNITLSSISVKTQPTKTSYYVGETLNTSGLTLTAKYNDGSTKTISSGFTYNPTSLTSAGTKTISVSYSGKSTSFNVSVQNVSLSSISVKTPPTKTSYYVGETLNTNGLTLTAKYNDGSTQTISSGFTCNPTLLTSAGTKKITVSYSGKSVSFSISVKENISASGTCGKNLNWTLKEGVLTISGTGKMNEYKRDEQPWYDYRSNIESIIIRDGVTEICDYAFYYCKATSVEIPASIKSIGYFSFANSSITSVTIPQKVSTIKEGAFGYCQYLKQIDVSKQNQYFACKDGVLFDKSITTLLQYPPAKDEDTYNVPDSVRIIAPRAIAFTNLKNTKLANVILPSGLQEIGSMAFQGSKSIKSINIPKTVTTIDSIAFEYWKDDQIIYVEGMSSAPNGWSDITYRSEATVIWNS